MAPRTALPNELLTPLAGVRHRQTLLPVQTKLRLVVSPSSHTHIHTIAVRAHTHTQAYARPTWVEVQWCARARRRWRCIDRRDLRGETVFCENLFPPLCRPVTRRKWEKKTGNEAIQRFLDRLF